MIGKRHKQSHAQILALSLGHEINAIAGYVLSRARFLERRILRIGRANAQRLSHAHTATPPALTLSHFMHEIIKT
jgi:hypothetical protein